MLAENVYKRVLEARAPLSREEARTLMQGILAGELTELRLAGLLGALTARPDRAEELAGFVDALHLAAVPVPLEAAERELLVDTCGTGADLSGTFNISTAAALVAAAASSAAGGFMVAKHGNRAVTSACGSADVLQALEIPVDLAPAAATEALRGNRFAFLLAPALHPALKIALPVRRALGVRTVFNVLGPLANPAGARAQVMGVYAESLVPVVAEAMVLLGVRHAFVVHGQVDGAATGMDELSISGGSLLAEVRDGRVTLHQIEPESVGLARAPIAALRGGDAQDNARILRAIFSGERGPQRDIVLLNAAAALVAAGAAKGADVHVALRAGIALAAHAIDSGAVTSLIHRLSGGVSS
jgi:anthranilate phosphoribosyltransferase